MTVLLDTQAFIWFNLDDRRLSESVRNTIEDSAIPILISPASYWEIAIKISRGKFKIDVPYEQFWQTGIDDNGFEILPIEIRHTYRLLKMPYHHKDPFDRLLVAQALAEDMPLASSDPKFESYGVQRLW